MRDLETKHDIGKSLTAGDVAWAGADVLTVFGAWKALKFLSQTRTAAKAGRATEQASMLERTTVFGRRILMRDAIGTQVAKLGAKVAAVYLVVRHPGLLSGLFVDVGRLLGHLVMARDVGRLVVGAASARVASCADAWGSRFPGSGHHGYRAVREMAAATVRWASYLWSQATTK